MERKPLDNELKAARKKSAKPMMWVSMISMTMMFAGLTSAYVISSNREDWVTFELPNAFKISTFLILLSSVTFYFSKRCLQKGHRTLTSIFLIVTLVLGFVFVFQQYLGFEALKTRGLFFTGVKSAVSSSMLLVIVFVHLLHLVAGIISLVVITYNHFRAKYLVNDMLGFELGAIFWHFLDLLWIGLFCFFYFNT